ncbi:MAG TPA: NAD(P)/FAD-dependent oxidoreductase [Micropepsaceae bacterium]|nr:NAD(P)/FAD-dependent oxidoreductase [Micropepsaceae bacterium]
MIRHPGRDRYDAVIIGSGIGALTAAAYLARSKARVLVLEANSRFGGASETMEFAQGFRAPLLSHVAYALDWRAVRELRLAEHGLAFAQPNMKMVALRPGGKHIVLPEKSFRRRTSFAAQAGQEGLGYVAFHEEAVRFARLLRPLWDGTLADPRPENRDETLTTLIRRLRLTPADAERLESLSRLSAAAFADRWLENDALTAALSFDVFPSGLSPQEPGSALVLIWRYAQESCGRQGAVSQILGGFTALAAALEAAARKAGAELRSSARVSSIIVEKRRAIGVTLADGEMIPAKAVLSSLDARKTLLDLVPVGSVGFGTAASMPEPERIGTVQIMLALTGPPPIAGLGAGDLGGRVVIAGRPETASEAKGAALNGRMPEEFAIEATVPTAADAALAPAGCHVLSALLPYMPIVVAEGWDACRAILRKRVLATLESFAPGLKDRLVADCMVVPGDGKHDMADFRSSFWHMLASYEARIRTPIAGLYLCGRTSEPVNAVCGRAGRIAAGLVFMGSSHQTGSP